MKITHYHCTKLISFLYTFGALFGIGLVAIAILAIIAATWYYLGLAVMVLAPKWAGVTVSVVGGILTAVCLFMAFMEELD